MAENVIDTDEIRTAQPVAQDAEAKPVQDFQEVDPEFERLAAGTDSTEQEPEKTASQGNKSESEPEVKPLTKAEKDAAKELAVNIIGAGVLYVTDKVGHSCGVTERQIQQTAAPLADVLEKYRITDVGQLTSKWGAEIKAAGAVIYLAFNMWQAHKKAQMGIVSGAENGDKSQQQSAA